MLLFSTHSSKGKGDREGVYKGMGETEEQIVMKKKKIYGLKAKEQKSRQLVSFNVFSGFYPIGSKCSTQSPRSMTTIWHSCGYRKRSTCPEL